MYIINSKKLEEMFLGKTDKVELLISALQKRIPEWLTEAKEAQDSKDPENIRKVCHRIRGAAGTITAERVEEAAIQWGAIIRENRTEEFALGYDNLINALKELEAFTCNK